MRFEESKRLKDLPPYLFAEIDEIIRQKKEKGLDVISLGIGDPDMETDSDIVDSLINAAKNPENHRYPSSYGLKEFNEAAANFYKDRFNIIIDPLSEVIPIFGAKEGIANIAYTFIDPGDYVIVPDPSYLVYKIGTSFAGGIPYSTALKEENGFLIDIDSIDLEIAQKSKLMHLNYPNNPTSAACDLSFFDEIVKFGKEFEITICHDNAYSDIYSDEGNKPISFLNAEGAKDVGIEFYSLSKSYNMTGWRIGFAVGNKNVIKSLGKYKTNVDSGVFNAIQYAGVRALENHQKYIDINNSVYNKRRNMAWSILSKIGIEFYRSENTIYVWSNVPKGHSSASFSKLLLDRANVVVTPGNAFGESGEGFFRISLTIPDARLEEALDRIRKVL
jgi:LL-diaminopimelate aminotransferase